ncbi:MAG: DsrE family protein [Candidatus Micrarchaeota archaeon]
MKIGVVIGTNDGETVWNAFRFGVAALKAGHKAEVFLINKGVEAEDIVDGKHDVKGQLAAFAQAGGELKACGTCLKARQKEGSEACPLSTMNDLVKLAEECDKVLTFG